MSNTAEGRGSSAIDPTGEQIAEIQNLAVLILCHNIKRTAAAVVSELTREQRQALRDAAGDLLAALSLQDVREAQAGQGSERIQ